MRDLLDRYLAAVARELPGGKRKDIVAELRDELLSKMEAREEELGRPLTDKEVAGILKDVGHPMVVGARYRRTQYVIGPDIFPFWWASMRACLIVALCLYLATAIVTEVLRIPGGAAHLPDLRTLAVTIFGTITLIAMLVERLGLGRFLYNWRPSQLPPTNRKMKSRFEFVVEIAMYGAALLWWTGVVHVRNWFPTPDAVIVDMAPVWVQLYWPILIYMVAEIGISLFALLFPDLVRIHAILALARTIVGAALTIDLLTAGHWLVISTHVLKPEILAKVQENFDLGMKAGLAATLALFIGRGLLETSRLKRALRDATPPKGPHS